MSNLSDKFEKELTAFFEWMNNCKEYTIYDNNNNVMTWNKNLLIDFIETPRKKLDGFLKNVFKLYIIKNKNNDEIHIYSNIIEKYKNLNYKNVNKCNDNIYKSTLSLNNVNEKEKISTIIRERSISNEKIVINNDLNTSKTWWLSNLEYTTEQLVNIFGNPLYTGNENTNHRYEWKFTFDNHVFSIYDWKFENSSFYDIKETDWFLCGDSNKYNKIIIKILDNLIM